MVVCCLSPDAAQMYLPFLDCLRAQKAQEPQADSTRIVHLDFTAAGGIKFLRLVLYSKEEISAPFYF